MKRKTKIICTLGPASSDELTLDMLLSEGMDVSRLNFSHGINDQKKELIKRIRTLSEEKNKKVMIFGDLQGPKLRLGLIEGTREIKKGEVIYLSPSPENDELPIQFNFIPFIKKDQRIFLNDGLICLKVTSKDDQKIKAEALNSGVVSSNKGINIPDTRVENAAFTKKDEEDLEFAIAENLDYVALSFVQTADDIMPAKKIIDKAKSKIKIIVKIEKKEAVENLDEIIKLADGLMVARGDLAIETNPAEVPIFQQKIIKLCRQEQKPVIVATQMLESMTENPRPTRAEASDVANAVLDQVDGVMLSGETASGKYPVETVKTMREIIESVEKHPDYSHYIKIDWKNVEEDSLSYSAITSAAASIAYRTKAKLIVVPTMTGTTVRLLSSFRPEASILAVSPDQRTCGQLNLLWGVHPTIVKHERSFDRFLDTILDLIKKESLLKSKEKFVLVTGSSLGVSGGTDTIKIVTV